MGYINPLLKLPAGQALLNLPPIERARIEAVMRELREQANHIAYHYQRQLESEGFKVDVRPMSDGSLEVVAEEAGW